MSQQALSLSSTQGQINAQVLELCYCLSVFMSSAAFLVQFVLSGRGAFLQADWQLFKLSYSKSATAFCVLQNVYTEIDLKKERDSSLHSLQETGA